MCPWLPPAIWSATRVLYRSRRSFPICWARAMALSRFSARPMPNQRRTTDTNAPIPLPRTATVRPDLTDWMFGLKVPTGPRAGEHFEVLRWQERFFRMVEREPGDLALSVAKGNGKTTTAAAIATACVHPEGPLHVRGAETVIVASGVRQAGIVYADVMAMLFPDDRPHRNDATWRVRNSSQLRRVDHRPSRASVEVIGSSPRRATGLRPLLVLADEPASWPRGSAGDQLVAALRTSLGKQSGSRLIALGTRPGDREHWFELMLRESPSLCFAADPSADVTDPKVWAAANPSLDHMESLRERIAHEAARAAASPTLLPDFRALRLNAAPEAHLIKLARCIEPEEWRAMECPPDALPGRDGRPIWGVELGGASGSSAIAAMWPTKRLEVLAAFPSRPDLRQRGRDDDVGDAYARMSDEGSVIVVGGQMMDYTALLLEGRRRFGLPGSIVCNRRRVGELGDALASAGLGGVRVEGAGRVNVFDSGGFVSALNGGRIRAAPSLLLRTAMSEVRMDRHGTLFKRTRRGVKLVKHPWDDAAVATVRAVTGHYWAVLEWRKREARVRREQRMEYIREMASEGLSVREIARRMNVSWETVSAVVGPLALLPPDPEKVRILELPFHTGSREERNERIRRMAAEGRSQRAIGDAVKLSRSSVGRILREWRRARGG